jgi:hypothetical protein
LKWAGDAHLHKESDNTRQWLNVYKALDSEAVAVTGGRMPSVDVPGLLLGDGLSFPNSEHGFSCMGVVNCEIFSVIYMQNAHPVSRSFSPMGRSSKPMANKVWAEERLYPATVNSELLEALMLYQEACEGF